MLEEDARVLANALQFWNQARSPRAFVGHVLPIIRGSESIDLILSELTPKARGLVVRELRAQYGHAVDMSGDWGMAGGTYLDEEARLREHAAYVAHAVGVAIPAIRSWLASHADESCG